MTLTDTQWTTVRQMLQDLVEADPGKLNAVNSVTKEIEVANGIHTYVVMIRWLDHASPHPRVVDNPQKWPPEMMTSITSTSPITTVMIEDEVAKRTSDPIAIYVTRDPTGRYGWKKLSEW